MLISIRSRLLSFRILVLILLSLPGSGRLVLDGLPFDSKAEFIFLVGVVGFVIAPKTAASLKIWLNLPDNRRLFLMVSRRQKFTDPSCCSRNLGYCTCELRISMVTGMASASQLLSDIGLIINEYSGAGG